MNVGAKNQIIEQIKKSDHKKIKNWHGAASQIKFGNIMDIVLYYISLQPDFEDVVRIDADDFYNMIKVACNAWIEKNKVFLGLKSAWMDGSANDYLKVYPGPCYQHCPFDFFHTSSRSINPRPDNWLGYRDGYIKIVTFPKWRAEKNMGKINPVFDLAETIYTQMRKCRNLER